MAQAPTDARLGLDELRKLVEDGQRLRKRYAADVAPMRFLTPDDLKFRSR